MPTLLTNSQTRWIPGLTLLALALLLFLAPASALAEDAAETADAEPAADLNPAAGSDEVRPVEKACGLSADGFEVPFWQDLSLETCIAKSTERQNATTIIWTGDGFCRCGCGVPCDAAVGCGGGEPCVPYITCC